MSSSIDRYIGIPFRAFGRDWEGVDCWGLVYLWHKVERQKELPLYLFGPDSEGATTQIVQSTTRSGEGWRKVHRPLLGDVIVFNLFGRPAHVGLIISATHMLHVERGVDSVVELYNSIRWSRRQYGTYRYVG